MENLFSKEGRETAVYIIERLEKEGITAELDYIWIDYGMKTSGHMLLRVEQNGERVQMLNPKQWKEIDTNRMKPENIEKIIQKEIKRKGLLL
jgi:hypothetical protein